MNSQSHSNQNVSKSVENSPQNKNKQPVEEKKETEFNPFAMSSPIIIGLSPESDQEVEVPEYIKKSYKEKLAKKSNEKLAKGRDRKDSVFAIEQQLVKNPIHHEAQPKNVPIKIEDKRPSFMTHKTSSDFASPILQNEYIIPKSKEQSNKKSQRKWCSTESNSPANCNCLIF